MTKIRWILDKQDDENEALAVELTKQGIEYAFLSNVRYWQDREYYSYAPMDSCVVYRGSLYGVTAVAKQAWYPGVYCNFDTLKCSYYYPRLHDFLLNAPYALIPFASFKKEKEFVYETFGQADTIFCRPDDGRKSFTGRVLYKEDFDDIEKISFHTIDPEQLIVVASPRNIVEEYRVVIVNKQPITSSLYKENHRASRLIQLDETHTPSEVLALAASAAKTFAPDGCFVMDIGVLKSGEIKVIELNSFSCSGLYKCNLSKIVEAVSQQAINDWREVNQI